VIEVYRLSPTDFFQKYCCLYCSQRLIKSEHSNDLKQCNKLNMKKKNDQSVHLSGQSGYSEFTKCVSPVRHYQILLRTDTRLVFWNRKLMRTTKPKCNFVNPVYCKPSPSIFTACTIIIDNISIKYYLCFEKKVFLLDLQVFCWT
jgi:hypothetical protein